MNNREKAAKTKAQIEKRLEILSLWNVEGVPEGYSLPKSLTKAKLWSDLELGIEKIGSNSSFVKTHRKYGKSVCDIEKKLDALNASIIKKPKSDREKQLRILRSRNAGYEESLMLAANQYAALRIQRDEYYKLYRVARQSQEDAQAELAEAEKTISELRSELLIERAKRSRKSGGNVTSVDFRGSDNQ